MRVLVTGSAGFIGSHFARRLHRDGWQVDGVDIRAKVRPMDCRRTFAESHIRYDLIVHCAAVVGGRAKIDGDPLAVATNIGLDVDAFRFALRTEACRFVYFSSSAAYPVALQTEKDGAPLTEADIDLGLPAVAFGGHLPDQTYGWAKLTGEKMAAEAARQGLRVHVFRPFSGYGSDQSDEYPFGAFVARARQHADPFDVWGSGRQVRDWIHVDDIVEAVVRATAADLPGPVNLGTGTPTSFLELAEMVVSAAGYRPAVRTLPNKPAGVHYRVADVAQLRRIYQPKVTLAEGIERALAGRVAA